MGCRITFVTRLMVATLYRMVDRKEAFTRKLSPFFAKRLSGREHFAVARQYPRPIFDTAEPHC